MCRDDFLEGVKEKVLPLGMCVDLFEDNGQVKVEVSQGDVAQGVGGGALDVLVGVLEALENHVSHVVVTAQVPAHRQKLEMCVSGLH